MFARELFVQVVGVWVTRWFPKRAEHWVAALSPSNPKSMTP